MLDNLSIIVPFYNGYETIDKLIRSLPRKFPLIIVDDRSDHPLTQQAIDREHPPEENNIKVIRLEKKGYFAGAVNEGIKACDTDVLVLNQDTYFDNTDWVNLIEQHRTQYAFIGERIRGDHPSFGDKGYIHGTFMWLRRDAIRIVGLFNDKLYPLWGNTAEYQWRVARKGFKFSPLKEIPGFHHERPEGKRFGSSITELLEREESKKDSLIRTPPLLSVVVLCHNYGRYIQDCIHSLIGGSTSLGEMEGQTIGSFEIIIVDDASTDTSWEFIQDVTSIEKGIRSFRLTKNVGTAQALNFGIEKSQGKYITFLSADDMRESDSLEKLLEICEQNPHSFAYDDIWLFHSHRRIKQWKMEEYDFETILFKNHVHAGIMFPKIAWKEVGGYPAIMNDGREDWAFNVALGIKGWCGVHIHNFGYLYRREGQNRTLTNTTPEHREKFLGKIASLFPEVYGGYRPVACCGKGNSKKNQPTNQKVNSFSGGARMAADTVGSQGMAKIEYLGKKMSATWTGDGTGANYTFGADGRTKGWIDKRDLGSRDGKVGFLSKKDSSSGAFLFRVVAERSAPVEKQEVSSEEVKSEESVEDTVTIQKHGSVGFSEVTPTLSAKSSIDFPDPKDMNVEEIKRLELSKEQWIEVYKAELSGRNRTGAKTFMEEKLGSWSS